MPEPQDATAIEILRLRTLLDSVDAYLYTKDRDGRYTYVNRRICELFGLPEAAILGRRDADFVDFAVADDADRDDRRLLESGVRIEAEERARIRHSGETRCYWSVKLPLRDDAGAIVGLSGISTDITERRMIEAELREREALLRQILDSSSVAIFLVGRDGIITHANQRMAAMFGCPLERLIGSEYVAHVHPDEREIGRRKMLALLASELQEVDVERHYWRDDGSQFWGRLTGRRFHDASGVELGLVGVIVDIDEKRSAAAERDAAQQRFRDLVESTAGIVWEADAVTVDFTYVSQEAERLLGYPVADWYRPGFWLEHLHPDDRGWAPQYCIACTGRLEDHDFEYRFVASDGRIVWLRDIVKVLAENGRPRWLRGVMVDITEQKRASQRLASVVETAMDGFMVIGADTAIRECNAALCAMTGYGREELRRMRIEDIEARETREQTAAHVAQVMRDGSDRFETRLRRHDGTIFEAEVTATWLSLGNEICCFVRDITQIKQHHRELDRIAHYDPLTGVPNRTLLADRMQQAAAQNRRAETLMAVCYLDLDGFKPVNDRFGHAAGDRVLVEIADRLQRCLRGADTVARIGGDEFVLLLSGLERADECETALQRILATVAAPLLCCDHSIELSASLGVALFPKDDADTDTLLRHADQAMYLAKQSGKNRYHLFDPENDRLARDRTERLARIRLALERREFVLFYQPQVNMREGRVSGAEALIRWQHPERGILPPADFLGVIEDSDLIVEVGDWVIEQALTQLDAWRGLGLDLTIGVNLAARQLLRHDFVERLEARLAAFPAVPPHALELEVLETAALEDVAHVSGVIRDCRALGIGFALDDFGTGYSSLAYLKSLPAETLKIDQSFVRDMLSDSEDLAIVEGVIGLARVFRRSVIAEGVETAEHGRVLLGLGCDRAQGYGIARPMPAERVPDWLRDWRPDPAWRA